MTERLVNARRLQSGFTLAETLLASVLGAMLLSSLALTTLGFTHTLDYMETAAGINNDADPVLRRVTKDIREAWWVTMPTTQKLDVADANGAITEYSVTDGGLWVKRPNGDMGKIYGDFLAFTMDPQMVERKREGPAVSHDGVFYASVPSGSASTLVASGSSQSIALAFTAPAVPSDVPGQASVEEQITALQSSVVDLPIAFFSGSGTKKIDLALYEGWAPGMARPTGTALASTTVNGTSLPAAQQVSGVWQVPSVTTPISFSAVMSPGVGYTLVITPEGTSNKAVIKAIPHMTTSADDQVATLSSGTWTVQPYQVPFDVKGNWTMTSTVTTNVISMITLTAYPTNRPLQQRSAAVLSQALSDDPWAGVVPGEVAP